MDVSPLFAAAGFVLAAAVVSGFGAYVWLTSPNRCWNRRGGGR